MVKKIFVCTAFVFLLLTGGKAFAQEITPQNLERLQIMEDSLLVTADSMYDAFLPDTHLAYSERFVKLLLRALKIPNSYYYSFDKLRLKINIVEPDDRAFKMYNWEITPSAVMKRYYGAIQMPEERLKLYGLLDYADQLGKGAEDSILTNRKWFGGIVYRIMAKEVAGRTVYNCFALNTSSPLSNKKVIDPMVITDKGLVFGAPIFGVASTNFPRQRINRFILEYKKGVQASMNWDEERKLVVFDKLASVGNDPNRKYTYAPTGQYDGFRWNNEMWNYMTDLMPVTILKDGEAPSDPSPQVKRK